MSEIESKSNHFVKKLAYDAVLKPLLTLAVEDESDDLQFVPDLHALVKNAHILPKPKSAPKSSPNPVILRLNAVDLRGKLFKYKKKFITSNPSVNFYEDLTRVNFQALYRTREREDVDRAWTRQGVIFFTKVHDKGAPKKIHRLQDPVSVLTKDDLRKLDFPYPSDLNPDAESVSEEAEDEEDDEDEDVEDENDDESLSTHNNE